MKKITFVGAGSLAFNKVITDLLAFSELRNDTLLCLEDIDEKRLNLMNKFLKKYKDDNPKQLENVQIEATTNQRKALTDARYVITAIQVGGLEAYQQDIEIPAKYGIHQVVGDSLGPGGVFRFLRSSCAFKSILEDLKDVGEYGESLNRDRGQKPILLNYTNPMAMHTWYCNSVFEDSTVGLCHGVQGSSSLLRKWVGAMNFDEFDFMCAGINHMAWFLKLRYKEYGNGEDYLKKPWKDAYPIIKEHFEDEPALTIEEKVRIDMMKATGYFMTESSGHLAEYLPYYLKREDLRKKFASELNTGFETLKQAYYLKECREKASHIDEKFEQEFMKENLQFKNTPSEEYASHIINALETGVHGTGFMGNFNFINKNQGLITNLPAGCAVEVPTFVDRMGFHPQGGIELPIVCKALCMSNIMVQDAAVQGALSYNKELVYHAILLDPNTSSKCSPGEIRSMVDEMFEKEKKWLPQFNG